MIGIYKITNLINGKSYIGQSKDIENRFKEHLHHHKAYEIGEAIHKYGKENFSFEILEECSIDKLDELEDYYIQKYNTISNGYNTIRGGQNNVGESNSNAKLTEQEVYNIREAYNNHKKPSDVYLSYKDKISFGYFQTIWRGGSWTNVHMDVYTPENKNFYKVVKINDYSYIQNNRKITDQDIYNIREDYANHKEKNQVYNKYSNNISQAYFDKIWNGVTYKHIHFDVYTNENKDYQRRQSISKGSTESLFTDEEVLYYRRKYAYECIPISELHKELQEKGTKCLYNTLYSMIKGDQYKRIPLPAIKFNKK